MDFGVIRNKKQAIELAERIMWMRLPFKYAFQPVYPLRSLESNNYYWGIVLAHASEATGHTAEEIHETCKVRHNFRYDMEYNSKTKQYEWVMGTKSTTILDDREIWDYIFKCRAEFEMELHVIIPLPNECMINELDYDHDKILQKHL